MSTKYKWNNLEEFMTAHVLSKDSTLPITHTVFGNFCAKYHIPENEQTTFLNLYYRHIIKPNKTHNIIERQLIEKNQLPGVLLSDIDLRFTEENVKRAYTKDDVYSLIQLYLDEIKLCCDMDEDVHFPVFVLEKPCPRVESKPTGNIVKDGIHVIIGLSFDPIYHQYFRDQVVSKISNVWGHIPIKNNGGFEDVIDPCISKGNNGWLLLNSKKKDDKTQYSLTTIYDVSYNTDDNKWCIESNTENIDSYLSKNHRLLSPRYNDRPILLTKTEMIGKIKKYEQEKTKPVVQKVIRSSDTHHEGEELGHRIPVSVIRSIGTQDDLDACLHAFLDAVNLQINLRDIRDAYDYVMVLPEAYYGDGSYEKWIRVMFSLRNTSVYLLIVWIAFSAKSQTFSFSSISDLCDKWLKCDIHENGGITKYSLMFWAQKDAPDEYRKVRENTLDYYLECTIESCTLDQIGKKKGGKGSTESDIALVLYQMTKEDFVCTAYKLNEWHQFKNHRWVKNDMGVNLRKVITNDLRDLYRNKAHQIWNKSKTIPDDDEEREEERNMLRTKADKVFEIAIMLGKTKEKENIMKEARDLFYNEEFVKKVNQNPYLLCFNNGVIDFKTNTFRPGYPEDFISKSTNIDYVKLDKEKHKPIIEEIEEYMRKLFPEQELCDYMWNHLSAVLIGDTALNQCLHYYTGIGQNGKSILVKLMQMILGEYAVELDVKFFTQDRGKIGGTSSELFATIGARYAITAEPSQGEKLNEGPMKQITSGTDKMSCRPLYGQQIEFTPQVNCVIMANHFLDVKSTDWGTWRRIRPVEFKSLFTDNPVEGDENSPYQYKKVDSFDEKFKSWAPIFMSMLVDKAFKTKGIVKECSIVRIARDNYRNEQDVVSEFISERLTPCENGSVKKSEIVNDFNDWYRGRYHGKINKTKELYTYMDKTYIGKKNVKGSVTSWTGVKVFYDHSKYDNNVNNDDCTTTSEISNGNDST